MSPKISILLPVYNGEKYIKEAIESVWNQTFRDFELIVIDDGSNDKTPEILDGFRDSRLVRLKHENNRGLAKALQTGLEIAQGIFITRMDADDISLPKRFENQIDYFMKYPKVGLVGTAAQTIDSRGCPISELKMPISHEEIFWKMFFECSLIEGSMMYRREIAVKAGGYRQEFSCAADTDLSSRLVFLTRFANLPNPLYLYRSHSKSIMSQHWQTQNKLSATIRKDMMKKILNREILQEEPVDWFFDKEMNLNQRQEKALISFLLELYGVFMPRMPESKSIENNLHSDLLDRIMVINHNNENKFLKRAIAFSRKIIRPTLRHKLKASAAGRFLTRNFHI